MKDFLVACALTLLGLAAGLLLAASEAQAERTAAHAGGPAQAATAPAAGEPGPAIVPAA